MNAPPPQIICKPFQSCALNLVADGSDDYKIHCIKESNQCEKGAKVMKSQLQILPEPHKNSFEGIDDVDVQDTTPAIMRVNEGSDSEDINMI